MSVGQQVAFNVLAFVFTVMMCHGELAKDRLVVALDGEVDEARLAQIHELAASLLSNPVIEDYVIREVTA